MTTINDLLAKLQTQTAQIRASIPTAKEAITVQHTTVIEPEHDWDSYDSSDIHMRQAEWEAQTRPVVIQHFVAKDRKLKITDDQRERANATLIQVMPGVQFGIDLTQKRAHELLVDFVGLDDANKIMTGVR